MGIWKEGIRRSKTNKPRKEDWMMLGDSRLYEDIMNGHDIKITVNNQDFTGYDLTMDSEVRKPKE